MSSPRERERAQSPPRSSKQSNHPEAKCLFIGNLAFKIRERELYDIMDRAGRVKNVHVGVNRRTGQSKGFAFVEFETKEDAEEAFKRFQDYELEGRRLRVDWDVGLENKEPRRGPPPRDRDDYRRRSRSPPRRRRGSPRYSDSRRSRSPRRSYSRSPSPRRQRSPVERKRGRSPSPVRRDSPKRGEESPRSPSPKKNKT